MTLPSVIADYRKKEIITRIKKFDSMMSQAVLLSEAQNGDAKYWEKVNTIFEDEEGNAVYDNTAGPEATYNFITKYIAPYIKYHRHAYLPTINELVPTLPYGVLFPFRSPYKLK